MGKNMKILLLLSFLWPFIAAIPASALAPSGNDWRLVWSDEFSGNSLNPANWSYEYGAGGWGNDELQTYTASPENVHVRDGNLVLKAVYGPDGAGGLGYTSARIITKGKTEFRYGKVAARIRLPFGQGPWPAFWLLGSGNSEEGWPDCGEIDIMESGRVQGIVSGALHFRAGHGYHQGLYKETQIPGDTSENAYHVYAVEWDNGEISWSIDGIKYFTGPINTAEMHAFHKPFFIILNLAVGGPETFYTGKKPPDVSVFPQSMYVDWVRVYKKDPPAR